VSEQVAARIRDAVRERGPITFAEYMEEALYGPGGFYEGTPVGERGHFVTSPHVHAIYSRLVGAAIEALWESLGRPVPLRLLEPGAGDGTMGRELVDGFARAGIDLEYTAVERSRGARASLGAAGIRVVETMGEVAPLAPGVVVANELLDNLAFRRVRRRGSDLTEVRIGLEGSSLVEVESPCDEQLRSISPALDEGAEAAVPTGALDFVDGLAASLRVGYALLIDYGSGSGPAGEVHGYREHRVVRDLLADPGSADITAGVDLGSVVARAGALGFEVHGPVQQSSALLALGLEEWMRAERARQGALLNGGRGADAVRAWEGRNRARFLIDPTGLGRLRWLLLATTGLGEPEWSARARALEPALD
jgi:SAM-dependent MidA family methyltransferase